MSQPWKWYVYIIECSDGLYYTGMTWNINERMNQHKGGKGSKFTSFHGFKQLVYMEEFNDIIQAREREHQIKDFSRKKKEALWKKNYNSSQLDASNNKTNESILRTN